VPLLPQTLSGTTTIGCASYTTQPSANNCPTAAAAVPGPGASSSPEVSPPTVLPISASASPRGTASAGQVSITDAFANTALSETTIIAGGVTEYWSKATFADLRTVTAPTTITTPIAQTNQDGSQFTISAAIIIVGPGGVW
jgi:hypothetical protein